MQQQVAILVTLDDHLGHGLRSCTTKIHLVDAICHDLSDMICQQKVQRPIRQFMDFLVRFCSIVVHLDTASKSTSGLLGLLAAFS